LVTHNQINLPAAFSSFPASFQLSGCHIYLPQAGYSRVCPSDRFSTLLVQFPRSLWSCLVIVLAIEISEKK